MVSPVTTIDAKSIDSVAAMEWVVRVIAKGLIHGIHRSQRLSSGMEFNQFRPYSVGDDIRLIDWKMLARSGKYYIRQSTLETDHKLHFIIDNSLSMEYEEEGMSKIILAKLLCATLSFLVTKQGDSISWNAGDFHFPKRSGMKHWQHSLQGLYDLQCTQSHKLTTPVMARNAVYLWSTDLYHDIDEIETYIKTIKHESIEMVIFHILGHKEESLDFPGDTTFIGLESGEKIDVNAKRIKNTYIEAFQSHIAKVKNLCYRYGVHYKVAYLNDPVQDTIKTFIDQYKLIGPL